MYRYKYMCNITICIYTVSVVPDMQCWKMCKHRDTHIQYTHTDLLIYINKWIFKLTLSLNVAVDSKKAVPHSCEDGACFLFSDLSFALIASNTLWSPSCHAGMRQQSRNKSQTGSIRCVEGSGEGSEAHSSSHYFCFSFLYFSRLKDASSRLWMFAGGQAERKKLRYLLGFVVRDLLDLLSPWERAGSVRNTISTVN